MEKLLKTYGFDLEKVIKDARENGNETLALEIERNIGNVQECFDTLAERHTSCPGDPLWKIDAEYLKGRLK